MARIYLPSRRAYAPRLWVACLIGIAAFAAVRIVLVIAFHVILLPIWVSLVLSFGVSLITVTVRWWIWRRRHPVITPQEYIQRMRDAAPWN